MSGNKIYSFRIRFTSFEEMTENEFNISRPRYSCMLLLHILKFAFKTKAKAVLILFPLRY
jgi:hypothetical protein